jgi:hypothetical protein
MNLGGERVQGQLALRYEDVAQDGRLVFETIPVGLATLWGKLLAEGPEREALLAGGVIPILTRLSIEASPGPFAMDRPLDVEGGYTLSHDVDARGQVARLLLDMDASLSGPKGRTNLPPPDDAGALALAGRVRAEHVFTRPFAAPEERKVLTLDLGDGPFVPPARRKWLAPATVLDVPEGARALDQGYLEDPARLWLGLTHTDSNQHVNSLVYPRFFEEVALRRAGALGRSTALLARAAEVAYRRPSFAGEQLRVLVRAYEVGEQFVCAGAFFGVGEDASDLSRARAFVRMSLEA